MNKDPIRVGDLIAVSAGGLASITRLTPKRAYANMVKDREFRSQSILNGLEHFSSSSGSEWYFPLPDDGARENLKRFRCATPEVHAAAVAEALEVDRVINGLRDRIAIERRDGRRAYLAALTGGEGRK